MEAMVKKYQQNFRKVRVWRDGTSFNQFRNAFSIIQRLQIIQVSGNYGTLKAIDVISHALLTKQMESLQSILLSINKTLEELLGGRQLVKGCGSSSVTGEQLEQRIRIKPSLGDCKDGLTILHDMHLSDKDDKMGEAEFDMKPFVEALKMKLQASLPNGTVVTRVQPSRQNCLAEVSVIAFRDGKMAQDMCLRLKNVGVGRWKSSCSGLAFLAPRVYENFMVDFYCASPHSFCFLSCLKLLI